MSVFDVVCTRIPIGIRCSADVSGPGAVGRVFAKALDAVGNYREVILLPLVPADQHLLAGNECQKLMFSLRNAGKVGEAVSGHALNSNGPPPFLRMPGLYGSPAQRFIHRPMIVRVPICRCSVGRVPVQVLGGSAERPRKYQVRGGAGLFVDEELLPVRSQFPGG